MPPLFLSSAGQDLQLHLGALLTRGCSPSFPPPTWRPGPTLATAHLSPPRWPPPAAPAGSASTPGACRRASPSPRAGCCLPPPRRSTCGEARPLRPRQLTLARPAEVVWENHVVQCPFLSQRIKPAIPHTSGCFPHSPRKSRSPRLCDQICPPCK